VRALQCTDSPVPVRNPRKPLQATGLPPFLGAYSKSDGTDTETVTAQVPGSVSIRTEDYGHGLYLTNQRCVIAHVNRYFVDGTLPAPNTVCPK
jgi:TAP-like protein